MWIYSIYILIVIMLPITNVFLLMLVKDNLDLMFIRLAGLLQSLVLNDKQLLQSSDCTDALRPYNG